MKRLLVQVLALCAGAACGLTGCRYNTSTPSSNSSISTVSSATHSPDSVPSASFPNALPAAWPEYTAPSPMPPPEGLSALEGKMLWPIKQATEAEAYDGLKYKYGFINEEGIRVLEPQYIYYSYFSDEQGRYQYLCASVQDRTDFFTMDGRKILEIPSESAYIVTGTDLVCAYLHSNNTSGVLDPDARVTMYNIRTGDRLLYDDYLTISILSPDIAIAVDPLYQEYLINLHQGENSRISLEGYAKEIYTYNSHHPHEAPLLLAASTLPPDWYGIMDRTQRLDSRFGYLDGEGKWAIEPVYLDALPFVGPYAGVETAEGEYRFIDRQGQFIDDRIYQNISHFYGFYSFFGGYTADVKEPIAFQVRDETGSEIFLNENLEPVSMLKNGWVDGCFYYNDRLIEGLPELYTEILYMEWPVVVAKYYTPYGDSYAYLLNMDTGIGCDMNDTYWNICKAGDYYVCDAGGRYDIYNADGIQLYDTVFQRYPSAAENLFAGMYAADGRYLWVTTAQYQGYVDEIGKWLYRESRFGNLAD